MQKVKKNTSINYSSNTRSFSFSRSEEKYFDNEATDAANREPSSADGFLRISSKFMVLLLLALATAALLAYACGLISEQTLLALFEILRLLR